ncbi:hypothetical protein C2S51_001565, partial [Perilla frutescens var. frutescens]
GLWILYFYASHSESIEILVLYAAVMLIALGRAGCSISLKEFIGDQLRADDGSCDDDERKEKQVERHTNTLWHYVYTLGLSASIYMIGKETWVELCMICGIAMGVAFMLFLAGSLLYEYSKPTKKSVISNLWRVFYAALVKRHLSHSGFHTSRLGWLDKAAVVESSPSVEEQVRKARLCTVEQVEEAKSLLNMVPLCTTFLVYGLLQATGNTFFVEQANYMNSNISVISLVVIKTFTAVIVSLICNHLFAKFQSKNNPNPKLVMLVRIGIGMILSPICCLVAWRVEVYRIENIVEKSVCISILWLAPQFFLLGSMQGLVFDGLVEIYSSLVPASLNKYGPSFAEFSLGIGHFLSLIFVLGFHNLFGDNHEVNRFEVYYRNLGFVCLANLLLYLCIIPYYLKQAPSDDADQVTEELQSLEESSATISSIKLEY